jgi:SAM-dependent methyltransferase
MFKAHGYETHGIDLSDTQLRKAGRFCSRNNLNLGIIKGDMREIPFATASMSFVYAYSSICHMTCDDAAIAMQEIKRVLKRGGLCFVNFCSAGGAIPKAVERRSPGEYPYDDDGLTGIHTLYADGQPDRFFDGFELLRRERRLIENLSDTDKYAWAEICYYARRR